MTRASEIENDIRLANNRIADLRSQPSNTNTDEELASLHSHVAGLNRELQDLPEYRQGGL